MENEDLLFIKKFNKIAIDKICKELGYNTGNICSGKASKEKIKEVRERLEKELTVLILKGGRYEKE